MILPDYDKSKVKALFDVQTQQLLPSAEKMRKLVKILTHTYRNQFIWVQELISNAVDSHLEAGVDRVARAKVQRKKDFLEVTISDFGVGLSPDRAKMTYTFLESTKEHTNDQIGGFGMGSKSPLAYTDSFLVESVHDNTRYVYLVALVDGFLTLSLLSEMPDQAINQTHVTVFVKHEDSYRLKNAFFSDCTYFTNVHFDWPEVSVLNHKKITYTPEFTINSRESELHLTIGPVKYPINFQMIPELEKYRNVGIGLPFEIGELTPLPTREDVEYTREAIQVIKDKAAKAIRILYRKLRENQVRTSDPYEFSKVRSEYVDIVEIGETKLSLSSFPGSYYHKFKVGDFYNVGQRSFSLTFNEYFQIREIDQYGYTHKIDYLGTFSGGEVFITNTTNSRKRNAYLFSKGVRYILRERHLTHRLNVKQRDYWRTIFPEITTVTIPTDYKAPVAPRESKPAASKPQGIHAITSWSGGQYYTLTEIANKAKTQKVVVFNKKDGDHVASQVRGENSRFFAMRVSPKNYKLLIELGYEDGNEFYSKLKERVKIREDREKLQYYYSYYRRISTLPAPLRDYFTRKVDARMEELGLETVTVSWRSVRLPYNLSPYDSYLTALISDLDDIPSALKENLDFDLYMKHFLRKVYKPYTNERN